MATAEKIKITGNWKLRCNGNSECKIVRKSKGKILKVV